MAAVAMGARAVAAVLGSSLGAVVGVEQRGDVGVDAEDHRASGPAVASVGTTERLELLAVHRRHAVAATAGTDVQRHPVDEGRDGHGGGAPLHAKGRPETGTPFVSCRRRQASSPGTMFTTRRPRRVPNCTAPAESANSVSSPPRPTLAP